MFIRSEGLPWSLDEKLIKIIQEELDKVGRKRGEATISFRDPNYTSERGGFHPVEISVSSDGRINYITDFAYVGRPPYSELAKEIDFDFSLGLFQHMGVEFPIHEGLELFQLWQSNFLAYYDMGVYSVSVTK